LQQEKERIMNLESLRILITGAGGGIGQALCAQLAAHNARLCLLDGNQDAGERMKQELKKFPVEILTIQADITRRGDREGAISKMNRAWGGVDILINSAGVMDFARLDEQDPGMMQRVLQVNVEAPLQLTRQVLPQMLRQDYGRIVNVGSLFGSIGFPCFAAYSASQFALRGFSQALRQELADTGVGVTYVSSRAVKTPFTPPGIHRIAKTGMMHMDDPHRAAHKIVQAIIKERDEAYLGFPEMLLARLNAVLPKLVSRTISKQAPTLISFTDKGHRAT